MKILDELTARGLVHDVTDRDGLAGLLDQGPVTFYCGFDPTGPSLHAGSLIPLTLMARLQRAGHRPIALVGGATGMVGDPSGKSDERKLLDRDTLAANLTALRAQIDRLLPGASVVNNYDWTAPITLLDFLRDVGKHVTVNTMLAKESVRARLEDREHGISFTEFSYMLLQAHDFAHLALRHGCRLQIGGSDQWGNITCGIDLTRRLGGPEVYGLVAPLLTTASGAKFGKTAAGTSVWLDPAMTSPYRFYQYWMNVEDADVERFLKLFTFVPLDEIARVAEEHARDPGRRAGQRRLATEMTTWLHGAGAARRAAAASEVVFGGSLADLRDEDLEPLRQDLPSSEMPRAELEAGVPLVELLVRVKLADSRGAARRLVTQGGVYLNNVRADDPGRVVTTADLATRTLLLLRAGKKNYHLLKV